MKNLPERIIIIGLIVSQLSMYSMIKNQGYVDLQLIKREVWWLTRRYYELAGSVDDLYGIKDDPNSQSSMKISVIQGALQNLSAALSDVERQHDRIDKLEDKYQLYLEYICPGLETIQ